MTTALSRQQLVIICIVAVAALLRFWNLSNTMLLFSDAGRDLLVAWQAVETKSLPLLGIPSSVPRFKQGPLSIWLMMAVFSAVGPNSLVIGYVFAMLGLLAVIATYEFLITDTKLSRQPGVVLAITLLIATFPLGIAQSRMPYHTTPIPLMLIIFLWSLRKLSVSFTNQRLLLAGLSWSLLFQFELALAPLLLLIPYLFLRKKIRPNSKMLGMLTLGIGTGLLPQLLHDITHRFEQLGLFGAWVGYRLLAFFGYGGEHTVGASKIASFSQAIITYGSRIVSFGPGLLGILGLFLVVVALIQLTKVLALSLRNKRQQLPISIELATVACLTLLAGYFVHGAPSEAYFPPFIVLFGIVLGYWLMQLAPFGRKIGLGLALIFALTNSYFVLSSNFFTNQNYDFHYGASFKDKKSVISFLKTQNKPFVLMSTAAPAEHSSYLDNYRWLLAEANLSESTHPSAEVFFIQPNHLEHHSSLIQLKPNNFGTVTVYSDWE